MVSDHKIIFAILAVLLTTVAYMPYLWGIVKGTNKPHIFTWIIWMVVAAVAFFAQLSEHAGPGGWVTGYIGLMCLVVSLLSLKSGLKSVTRGDIVLFAGALAAIPVWMLTNDPFWSVIIVTVINSAAFYPTFRKSWTRPHEEHITVYAWNVPRQILTIAALSQYSVVTVLFPASIIVMCTLFVGTILYRRRMLEQAAHV